MHGTSKKVYSENDSFQENRTRKGIESGDRVMSSLYPHLINGKLTDSFLRRKLDRKNDTVERSFSDNVNYIKGIKVH